MNRDITEGKLDQMKGKVKQSVGEAIGNEKLANSGAADQVKGAAREALGNTKDAAKSAANVAHAHAESHSHDIRAKITSTAQNAKNAVSDKAKQIKNEYKRTA
jgi:uncharacterized protein YjbJ (UPF0337 family)